MTPSWFIAACGWGLFLLVVTAMAFESYDFDNSPDPGSYWQGSSQNSGYASDSRRGYSHQYSPRDSWQFSPGNSRGGHDSDPGYGPDRNSNWNADQRWAPQPDQALDQGSDQGSNQTADQAADQAADWYSSDWYQDQVLGRPRNTWQDGRQWSAPATRSQILPGQWADDVAEPLQQRDDWSSDGWSPDCCRSGRQAGFSTSKDAPAPFYPSSRYRDVYRDDDAGTWLDDPRAPVQTPRYRFRDDPRFKDSNVGGIDNRYRFRPLTAKELERHRESTNASGFRSPSRGRQSDARPRAGDGFGYEPSDVPDSFYRRYYRGGP